MQATLALPVSVPVPMPTGSLEAYIQTVNRFPILSAEEERALAQRWRENEDLDAARGLVLSHLRLVVASPAATSATACRTPTSSRKATSAS
jgi:RNA polymerase sigma-32 factor